MPVKDSEEANEKREIWRMYKNIIVIGIAFMLQFTGFNGAGDLQSSINAEAGLGTVSLAAGYAGLMCSNIFLPAAIIKLLGTKWTIFFAFIVYTPYLVVQLWPSFYSMIPVAFIMGLGGGPLWCAVCIYVTVVSEAHSKISKISTDILLPRFMGIFFIFFHLGGIWGNLISSLVLRSGNNKAAVTSVNASQIPEVCGANFLPSADAGKTLQHQPLEKIQMLTGIYVACVVAAVLIIAFGVDSMKRYESDQSTSSTKLSGLALLTVTVKLLSEPDQLLIIIISMFIGIQNVFFTAGISAAYVSCSIGTGTIGFVMMAHGITDVIGSAITASLSKLIKRVVLLSFTSIVYVILLIFLLVWKPQAHSEVILFSVALLWGLCSSTFLVQISAYYGLLFPHRKEAAFSNFRIWKSIGYVIAYVTSHHMRTNAKIYMTLGFLIAGVLCYFVIEYRDTVKGRVEKRSKLEKGVDNIAYKHNEQTFSIRVFYCLVIFFIL